MNDEIAFTRAIRGLLQSRPLEAVIAAVAARQHGLITRWQLLVTGLSEDAIERRLASGRLHRIHRGVYAVGHKRLTRLGWWMAAVLAAGPGAVLSHRSAAALQKIRNNAGPKIEVTVPHTAPRHAAFAARRSHLQPDEITEIEGIPCTTVSRTLLDIAATCTPDDVARAIREAERLELTDETGLEALLERYPRKRGIATLRRALARASYGTGHTKQELEARFKRLLFDAQLPPPEFNALIELGETTYEVDVLWRDVDLIVELDGWQSHRTRAQFEEDRERDRRLTATDYRVIRLTWRQLGDPGLMRELAGLLGVRHARPPRRPRRPARRRASPERATG